MLQSFSMYITKNVFFMLKILSMYITKDYFHAINADYVYHKEVFFLSFLLHNQVLFIHIFLRIIQHY